MGTDSVESCEYTHEVFRDERVDLIRHGRFLHARLLQPHLVLSTSYTNGGQQERVLHLINHQSCEAAGHRERFDHLHAMGQDRYHDQVCAELDVPPDRTVVMGTAANMQYAAVNTASFEEFQVRAIVTGGVTGNAGRAGDPASWIERGNRVELLQHGTINMMLLFNTPLTPAALSRAVVTMTEGKSAVLQELGIRSRSGRGLATGTGTDQFCLAAPLTPQTPVHWTGKHCKMGELIAGAAMNALRDALRWQNGLEPSMIRNICLPMQAFGLSEDELRTHFSEGLPGERREFFQKNFNAIVHDPTAAASIIAITTIQDRVDYGVLPPAIGHELTLNQAALMATAVACRPSLYGPFRKQLADLAEDLPRLIIQALILGWQEKWR